jgi:serine/threonine-protein kinase HipA
LKNFSLLEGQVGLRLSPAYDVVNAAFYDGFDQTIALSINGTKHQLDNVTRDLLSVLGKSIGLSERAVELAFKDLHARVKRAAQILTPPQGEPPDGFVHRYAEIVSRACLRILGD